mgnify:CR=1 FL=1
MPITCSGCEPRKRASGKRASSGKADKAPRADSKKAKSAERKAAREALDAKAKPANSLGTLEDMAISLCSAQRTLTPRGRPCSIVVFCADHGDLAGAHGQMIQKWHSAYEEAIHVPMVDVHTVGAGGGSIARK